MINHYLDNDMCVKQRLANDVYNVMFFLLDSVYHLEFRHYFIIHSIVIVYDL